MKTRSFSLKIALIGALLISGIPSAFAQDFQVRNEAASLNNQGVALMEEGRYDQALPLFNRSLALEEDHLVFFNRASTLYGLRRFDEALKDVNRMLQRNSANVEGLELRSQIYMRQRKFNEAFADTNQLLQIEPDNLLYAIIRGSSAYQAQKYVPSLDSFFYAHTLAQKPNPDEKKVDPESKKLIRATIATMYGILGVPVSSFLDKDEEYPTPTSFDDTFKPKATEIRLDGICSAIDAKTGTVTFDALTVSMSNGTTKVLPETKAKVLKMGSIKPINANNPTFSGLPKVGDFLVVVGTDNGKLVTPRAIALGAAKVIDPNKEPNVNFAAIGRPKFVLSNRSYTAGTAFFVTRKNQNYMVSAWHLLQDENAQTEDKGAKATLDALKEISVAPFTEGEPIVSQEVITRTGFDLNQRQNDYSGDLLVAKSLGKTAGFPLAREIPDEKQSVWIAAKDTLELKTKARRAVVTRSSDNQLVLTADPKEQFPLTAMSGAPILNSEGEVVGVVLGGGKTKSDLVVYAAPITALRARFADLN